MNFIIKKKGSEIMSFQENLRYYREKAGYKQAKDFAEALNIPYSTYTGYEVRNREPKYETLCKIADLLQVSTDDLLGRTTNILGTNEDERLKKELNNLLNPNEVKNLQIVINNIDKEDIHCSFLELQQDFFLDKSGIISIINTLNEAMEDKKKNIFQKSLFSSFLIDIILLTDRRMDNIYSGKTNLSKDKQEKEIKKMLAIQKEVSEFLGIDKQLPKLQDIKCNISNK
ncbi:XRE family transcriptional regulator [Megamonas rupellensis]|nr:XRE family transcriptional regulator [Megamonas rupellensis]